MALDHKFSNTGAATVGELLRSNEQFLIPRFQRNYSWSSEKVETLWNDLIEGYNQIRDDPKSIYDVQYMLGPVVLVRSDEGPGRYWIIDGQQRLSTLTMLFCVARDIMKENGLNEYVGKINDVIQITHMGQHSDWKLVLNDTDKYFFKEIQNYEGIEPHIRQIENRKGKTRSETRLLDCYKCLYYKTIEALCTDFGRIKITELEVKNLSDDEKSFRIANNIGWLNYFLTHVQDNHYLVKIMVKDDNVAFQIFETLNQRGQQLSKSNLIKNHVISQVKNKNEQIELSDRWNGVFDSIIGVKQNDDEFIMESFRSRNPREKISKKNLFAKIKEKTQKNDEKACLEYIKELEEDSEFITTLNDPSEYKDADTSDDIRAIEALGAKFIRIPILAAYRKWRFNDDYRTLVKFLIKFFFKYRIIRQKHPGDVDKIISITTLKILKGDDVKDIIAELKNDDDHENFKYNFNRFITESTKNSVAKYILRQITLYLRPSGGDDVKPIDDLTLEHILPQKYKEKWPESDFLVDTETNMESFVGMLGNLTLLTDSKNTINRNNTFNEKKEIYKELKLDINIQTVAIYDKWTSKIIEKRNAKFCEYADKIWSLDKF